MLSLGKSSECEAEWSSLRPSHGPGLVGLRRACRPFSRLVGEDPDQCLVEEIPAEGFDRRRHAVHVFGIPADAKRKIKKPRAQGGPCYHLAGGFR